MYELNNDYIKQYYLFLSQKEIEEIKKEYYFLLIEVDMPFFHDELEKYADIIELIDTHGINENMKNDDDQYSYQIKPFIQPNYIFSIFTFTTKNFESKGAENIVRVF